jgi:hypothetical protein
MRPERRWEDHVVPVPASETIGGQVELGDGIFVSSLATQDFAPDPDVPGTEQHIPVEAGQRSIEIKDGPTIQLGVGDVATLPKGAETTWHLTVPFKEFWVLG